MINYDPVYDWGGLLKDYTLNYINYFQTDFLYVLASFSHTFWNWNELNSNGSSTEWLVTLFFQFN